MASMIGSASPGVNSGGKFQWLPVHKEVLQPARGEMRPLQRRFRWPALAATVRVREAGGSARPMDD